MGDIANCVHAVSDKMGIPREILGNCPVIEVTGNTFVSVEGHRGITAYTDSMVCIRTGIGSMTVSGTGLKIQSMNRDRICVQGTVFSVSFGGEAT